MSNLPIELQKDEPELENCNQVKNLKKVYNEETLEDTSKDSTFVKNHKIVYGAEPKEEAAKEESNADSEPAAPNSDNGLFVPPIDTQTGSDTDGSPKATEPAAEPAATPAAKPASGKAAQANQTKPVDGQ